MKIFNIIFIVLIYSTLSSCEKSNNALENFYQVKKGNLIQKIRIEGIVHPHKMSVIRTGFSGQIKKIFVKTGSKVKMGDPLILIVQEGQTVSDSYPIKAPFDGTIVYINVQEDEYLELKDNANIMRLDTLNNLHVRSKISESDINKIKNGMEAIVKMTALFNKTYNGVIEDISLSSESENNYDSSHYFSAKIKILNPDNNIRPGMSASCEIVTLKKDNILLVPHEYIIEVNNDFFIFQKNNIKKKVTIGEQNESYFEIKEGLNEGDEIKQIDFSTLDLE